MAIFTVFGASFVAMLPVYARDVLHAGAGGYGALMSAFGLGAAAGALSIAGVGHRIRREPTAVWAGVAMGTALVLLGLVHSLGLALIVLVAAGLSMALNAIMTNTVLQTGAPDYLRGQVVGFYSFIVVGLVPFGSFQAGWISEHAGTATTLLVGGAICLVAASVAAWGMRTRSGDQGVGSRAPLIESFPAPQSPLPEEEP